MRKLIAFGIVFCVLAVLCTGNAVAYTVTFGDSTHYWGDTYGGWNWAEDDAWSSSDAGVDSSFTPDDENDYIGHPNFTGGSAEISSDGILSSISFDYLNWSTGLTRADLFIDLGADQTWDYVVTTDNNIYQILTDFSAYKGDNDEYYKTSDYVFITEEGNSASSWDWRNEHPVKWDKDDFATADYSDVGDTVFTGFNSSATSATFSSLNIDLLGEDFIIAWSPTCANDVVYEKIDNPVPEPATMLLLATGLIGIAGVRRKRMSRK